MDKIDYYKPSITFAKCGTQEEWDKAKVNYADMCKVIPGTLYINKDGLCLVTSREWSDWLQGKRIYMPENEGVL